MKKKMSKIEKQIARKNAFLKKAIAAIETVITLFNAGLIKLTVKLSDGNSKIGKIWNFNMFAILSCNNDCDCAKKGFCYAIYGCYNFASVIQRYAIHWVYFKLFPEQMFDEIIDILRRKKKNFFFRWHSSGEILNSLYFAGMVKVAKALPKWRFYTYTKRYAIVNDWIRENGNLPDNLIVIFSHWKGFEMDNPYNLPVAYVKLEDGSNNEIIPQNSFHCHGNCDTCKKSGKGCMWLKNGQSVYFDEHSTPNE